MTEVDDKPTDPDLEDGELGSNDEGENSEQNGGSGSDEKLNKKRNGDRKRKHKHSHRHKSTSEKGSKHARSRHADSDEDPLRSPSDELKYRLDEYENRLSSVECDRDANFRPHEPMRKRYNRPCPKFLIGRCHRADEDCYYIHDGRQPEIMELCKFYANDRCAKLGVCSYLHKGFPCKWFHTSLSCDNSPRDCRFSHDPLTDETRMLLIRHLEMAPRSLLGNFPMMNHEDAYVAVLSQECRTMMFDSHPMDSNVTKDGYVVRPPPSSAPGPRFRSRMPPPHQHFPRPGMGPKFGPGFRPMRPFRPRFYGPPFGGAPAFPPLGPPMMDDCEKADVERQGVPESIESAESSVNDVESAEAAAECAAIEELDKLVPDDIDWNDIKMVEGQMDVDSTDHCQPGNDLASAMSGLVPYLIRLLVKPKIDYSYIIRQGKPSISDMERDPRLAKYISMRDQLVNGASDPRKMRDPRRPR